MHNIQKLVSFYLNGDLLLPITGKTEDGGKQGVVHIHVHGNFYVFQNSEFLK